MAEVTKRATKKALAEFCEANNLTDVKINNMLHTLYPNEFIETDEIAPIIIKIVIIGITFSISTLTVESE